MQELSSIYTLARYEEAFAAAVLKLKSYIVSAGTGETYVHGFVSDSLKFSLYSWMQGQTEFERAIYGLIFEACSHSEHVGPGSFRVCLEALVSLLESFRGNAADLDTIRREVFSKLFSAARQPDVDELRNLVRTVAKDELVYSLLWEAVELSGIEGKISVEKTTSNTPSLELINGYNFNIKCSFDIPAWRQKKARCLVIDGVIESVSEVHHILETFSNSKEPLLVFARGFHEEVILTMKTNFNRRTLNVMPFAVPYDIDGINLLNDIAIVCGTDVVSALKGELISCIKTDNIQIVEDVAYKDGVVTIINSTAQQRVAQHARFLVETKSKLEHDVGELYDRRIKALTPSYVVLRLPEKMIMSEKVEITLHTIRSALSFGLVDMKKFVSDCETINRPATFELTFRTIMNTLKTKEKLPANFVLGVFKYMVSCYNTLKSVGAVVSNN